MLPIFGSIKILWNVIQLDKLDKQIADLTRLVSKDVLSLVPEPFRDCAKLRISVSQSATDSNVADVVVSKYESIRKAALDRMMEEASGQSATKADVIKLEHTLADYARAAQNDLDRQSGRLDSMESQLAQAQAEISSSIQSLKIDVASQAQRTSHLDLSIRSLRNWLIALSAVATVEGIALLCLIARL